MTEKGRITTYDELDEILGHLSLERDKKIAEAWAEYAKFSDQAWSEYLGTVGTTQKTETPVKEGEQIGAKSESAGPESA